MSNNRMGKEKINSLLWKMALPMMLSMFVQALYNVVDSFFVSRISDTTAIINAGDKAVQALALAFPAQMLLMAFCLGTGVGINAVLSKSLGQKDSEKAKHTAGNGFLLYASYSLIALIFGLFFVDKFIATQSSDAVVNQYAYDYLNIIMCFSFSNIFYLYFEKLLQGTSKTTEAMLAQLVGSITNIILDPIMIFGLFGCPQMDVKGAALATIIGQSVSCLTGFLLHHFRNTEIKLNLQHLKPNLKIIKQIYKVGIPSIITLSINSIVSYVLNLILISLTPAAVTAYGIYNKIQSFIFMPVFGLNNASIPLIAYNYGARDKHRVKEALFAALKISFLVMLCGTIILQLCGNAITSIFILSDESYALCNNALKIISLGFVLEGFNIILQGYFQALGRGLHSLFISALKSLLILLPLAYLLAKTNNPTFTVWFALPLTFLFCLIISAYLAINLYRNKISCIEVAS